MFFDILAYIYGWFVTLRDVKATTWDAARGDSSFQPGNAAAQSHPILSSTKKKKKRKPSHPFFQEKT